MPIDPIASAPVIVVQAARLPQPAGDAAFSTVRIDPTILTQSTQLDEALDSAPGFSLFRRTSSLGANPTTQGVSLREIAGSGASRALVTLDGAPQNDPFGGWVIWTALPVEAISSATLVRGAGSGPYGAGALTGVVALEQPDQPGHLVADVSGGDHGYRRAAGAGGVTAGPVRIFLDASDEQSGGWVPVIQGRGAADRPLTLRDWSAAERALIDLGDTVLSERIGAYQESRGAGTVLANSRARGLQGSLSWVRAPTADGLGWRLQTWVESSDLANVSASVAANRNTATLADNQYATPAIGAGLNAALRRTTSEHSWEVGLDLRDFAGESREQLYSLGHSSGRRVSGGGEWIAGLYGEGSQSLGPVLLTGGLRLDSWNNYGSKLIQTGSTTLNQHPADRGGVAPTGRIGLKRDLSSALYLRTAVYAGFRPATLNELHRPFRVGNDITLANPNLTPERLYGAEAGMGRSGRVTWDVDAFYNRLVNAVTNVTIGKGPGAFPQAGFVPMGGTLYMRENAGVVNAYGLEGEADSRIGPNLTLRAAFTYTRARVDGGSEAPQLTGLRPAQTPTTTVTAGIDWRVQDRLTLTGALRYEGERFDDDQNSRRIDAATGVDARAEWRLARNLSGYIAAENVLDANIQTGRTAANVVSYDAPRLVRIGITLRR